MSLVSSQHQCRILHVISEIQIRTASDQIFSNFQSVPLSSKHQSRNFVPTALIVHRVWIQLHKNLHFRERSLCRCLHEASIVAPQRVWCWRFCHLFGVVSRFWLFFSQQNTIIFQIINNFHNQYIFINYFLVNRDHSQKSQWVNCSVLFGVGCQ